MNIPKVISRLNNEYPGKNIIKNDEEHPTEIIREIEPTENHPEHSIAIAVIDQSLPHYHKKTVETYEVMEGELIVIVDGTEYKLNKDEKLIIKPESIHSARGNQTIVRVSSKPGWTFEDHILIS